MYVDSLMEITRNSQNILQTKCIQSTVKQKKRAENVTDHIIISIISRVMPDRWLTYQQNALDVYHHDNDNGHNVLSVTSI